MSKPALLTLLGFALVVALAAKANPDGKEERSWWCNPGTYTGNLEGAPYQIIIPSNWNKVLVVYVHGYSWEVPAPAAFFVNPYWPAGQTTAAEILLSKGYALAASSFSAGGWAVKEGLEDTEALIRNIESLCGLGCWPDRTILFGISLGSLVVLKKAEERQGLFDRLYDGVVSGCSIGAGASRTVDLSLQFNLGFDAAFYKNGTGGWPAAWGTPQFLNNNIDFYSEVEPYVGYLLESNQLNFGLFEFQRLVSLLSAEDYYPFVSPPPSDVSLFTDFFFSTQALGELQIRAGGKVTGNIGKSYSLSEQEIGYLASLGVDAPTLLAYMNSQCTYKPDKKATEYLKKYSDFTGRIRVPVLTVHTRNDGLIPATSDSAYKQTVAHAGRSKDLYQVYTTASGHCNFSPDQVVSVIVAMDQWLAGKKPTPVDFPESLGFQPADYTPGPWPY